jgi:Immunity protein 26
VKRQRWTYGAIVTVPLGEGYHSYAQMLGEPEYAFFDCRTRDEMSVEAIVACPVLFRLWVMRHAHSKGRWQKVGTAPVSAPLQERVLRYNQDALRPQDIRLTYDGCSGPLGSLADCEGLECAAVWDPEHVEDRLRDHYAGVPNKWVLSLRPKVITPNQTLHLAAAASWPPKVQGRSSRRGR